MITENAGKLSATVVRTPEFKEIGEKLVMGLRVAHNDRKNNGHFFNVEAWNGLASSCTNLKKGDPVLIDYRLVQDQWKENDEPRSAIKLVASFIHFLPRHESRGTNRGYLSCNVVRAPEVREVGDSKLVLNMRVAHNDRRDRSHFFTVEGWDFIAKTCRNLTTGSLTRVEYRLVQGSWEDKDGNKRSNVKLVADEIHFLSQPQTND